MRSSLLFDLTTPWLPPSKCPWNEHSKRVMASYVPLKLVPVFRGYKDDLSLNAWKIKPLRFGSLTEDFPPQSVKPWIRGWLIPPCLFAVEHLERGEAEIRSFEIFLHFWKLGLFQSHLQTDDAALVHSARLPRVITLHSTAATITNFKRG